MITPKDITASAADIPLVTITHIATGGDYFVMGFIKVKIIDEWVSHVQYVSADDCSASYARQIGDFQGFVISGVQPCI